MATPGYVLTVEGCPISFGTSGLVGVTSSDSNWPSNVTMIEGTLETPQVSWHEKMNPLKGTIDVGGITVRLRDKMSTGSVAAIPSGRRFVSYLGTRVGIPGTRITSTITAGATSFVVADSARIDSAPTIVYLNQEAIRVGSIVGNTLGTLTRGYYGTRAVQHNVDNDHTQAFVFSAFPGFDRCRAILWRVGTDGIAVVKWIGYCSHAPRQVDTFVYEMQCDHFTKTNAGTPVGPPKTIARMRGIAADGMGVAIKTNGAGFEVWDGRSAASVLYGENVVFDTMLDAIQHAAANVQTPAVGAISRKWSSMTGSIVTVYVTVTGATAITLRLRMGTREEVAQNNDTADPRTTLISIDNAPSTIVRVPQTGVSKIPIDRVDGLPASWGITATPEADGSQTFVSPMLQGELDEDTYVQLLAASHTDNDTDLTTNGPSVTGLTQFRARKPYARSEKQLVSFRGTNAYLIDTPVALRLTYRLLSNHWIYALRRGTIEDTTLNTGIDSRQYDWDDAHRVIAVTSDAIARREWFLDGSKTFGELQSSCCLLSGCAPGLREGRQTIVPIQPPLPTDVAVGTITETDLASGQVPKWITYEAGIVNTVHVESEYLGLTVQDDVSVARFRETKATEIDITNSLPRDVDAENPITLSQVVMRRYIGVFSVPHRLVTMVCKPSLADAYTHGDVVQLSLRSIPDGEGGYGVTDAKAVVVEKSVSTKQDANVTYGVMIFTHARIAGYSPCARVASIASATITIDTGYIDAVTTDYAGSNLTGYRGTANDGGTSFFAAEYMVEMFERDSETPFTEVLEVLSVNIGSKQITFTTTPDAGWAALIAAGMVDIRFAPFATVGVQDAQKEYAYVGAESPAVIESTSTTNHRFSP